MLEIMFLLQFSGLEGRLVLGSQLWLVDILKCLYSNSTVCYFFCKAGQPGLTGVQDIIRTFAYQLVQNDSVARSVLETLKRTGFQTDEAVGVAFLFEKLLKEPLQHAGKEICIVLDALDEADSRVEDQDEHAFEINIFLKCLASLNACRIIALSVPGTELERILPITVTKTITAKDNGNDIEEYVPRELKSLPQLQGYFDIFKEDPVAHFVTRANGVFLWAFLVFQQFKLLIDRAKTKQSYENAARNLFDTKNTGLDNRFSSALSRVQDDHKPSVITIFGLLSVAIPALIGRRRRPTPLCGGSVIWSLQHMSGPPLSRFVFRFIEPKCPKSLITCRIPLSMES